MYQQTRSIMVGRFPSVQSLRKSMLLSTWRFYRSCFSSRVYLPKTVSLDHQARLFFSSQSDSVIRRWGLPDICCYQYDNPHFGFENISQLPKSRNREFLCPSCPIPCLYILSPHLTTSPITQGSGQLSCPACPELPGAVSFAPLQIFFHWISYAVQEIPAALKDMIIITCIC